MNFLFLPPGGIKLRMKRKETRQSNRNRILM
jgi:hypothetical protein